ncbi:Uncharacterized conserved protein YgbK, DUF1537 family [Tranquillimonas rosea]|uniref:3-oxo-tetronate kinase n=1 Tax=Tranquillimonas rosea TaxID=641238 RepID=A0A1H9WVD2_9RHOB|nr:3-oxo-tetronate kinase [Tranquillimonas rosea]SES37784.1 Uncharacterized conserved protein YgbK, DUF1537 family [Tranquillimonas rosea]
MKLGCIGDDFTGSSDLANVLAKGGLRVTQITGVPDGTADPDVDAGVVALKSRTIPVEEAVRRTLEAFDWLAAQGCSQFFFKYCSTFDSTPDGNIGPVIDALMARLGDAPCVVCPAFPQTGRSVYQGHLFVGDTLLSESGMETHPLTPMTDPDIRRWLSHQTRQAVGHVPADRVFAGDAAIRESLWVEHGAGRPVVVVDAIRDADLLAIGAAARDLPLITGGSGVALGLPANLLDGPPRTPASEWAGLAGQGAVLAGSGSRMTHRQVQAWSRANPALAVDADAVMAGRTTPGDAAAFVLGQDTPALVYSVADPASVRAAQERHGREAVATGLEQFFADVARQLVDGGVRRLVTAGGETSGAVVEGLGLTALEIGPEIAPGVPAVRAEGRDLVLALKSGNFGGEDFFSEALDVLGGTA